MVELTDEERQPCECYTRIMGYYRQKTDANLGKQSEFKERKEFIIDEQNI